MDGAVDCAFAVYVVGVLAIATFGQLLVGVNRGSGGHRESPGALECSVESTASVAEATVAESAEATKVVAEPIAESAAVVSVPSVVATAVEEG